MKPVAFVLSKALNKLDGGDKWIRDNMRSGEGYCMSGAIAYVRWVGDEIFRGYAHMALRQVIKEQFPDRYNPKAPVHELDPVCLDWTIPNFNDDPRTNFDDVRLVFEKAILHEEEAVS